MSEEYGRMIGNIIGKVREVDVQPDGSGWWQFLRVQIELDLIKPIARGRSIKVLNYILVSADMVEILFTGHKVNIGNIILYTNQNIDKK